ncbi:MAG: hypothetical protein GY768_11150 [Planctomycetaceae bacterium]|nr:hypothetical protein [Planctomycetaceae bacterium]
MPITNATIAAAVTVLKSISPVGGFKIESVLLAENLLWPDIAAQLETITARTPFYWSWQSTARAWLLIKLCTNYWTGPGLAPAPTPVEINNDRQHVNGTSESTLRNEIWATFDPQAVLRVFEQRKLHPSRTRWNNAFSDPNFHDPNNFLYLIHAMRPTAGIGVDKVTQPKRAAYLRRRLNGFLDPASLQTTQWTLLSGSLYLSQPEILQTELLSCSVIRNNHVKTYAKTVFGYILSAPGTNIAAAEHRDLAASAVQNMARSDQLANVSCEDETMIGYARLSLINDFYHKLLPNYYAQLDPPDTIVNRSTSHNEVLVIGSMSTSVVRPAAIFIKTSRQGKICTSFLKLDAQWGLGSLMATCSRNLNIPIVPIPDDDEEASQIDFQLWRQTAFQRMRLSYHGF